jgi:hypothetical protein
MNGTFISTVQIAERRNALFDPLFFEMTGSRDQHYCAPLDQEFDDEGRTVV